MAVREHLCFHSATELSTTTSTFQIFLLFKTLWSWFKFYNQMLANSHVESEHNMGFDFTSNISRESHLENVCNISRKIGRGWVPDRTSCAFHCDEVVNILLEPFVTRLVVREDYCEVETCDKVNGEGTGSSAKSSCYLQARAGQAGLRWWANISVAWVCLKLRFLPAPSLDMKRLQEVAADLSRGGGLSRWVCIEWPLTPRVFCDVTRNSPAAFISHWPDRQPPHYLWEWPGDEISYSRNSCRRMDRGRYQMLPSGWVKSLVLPVVGPIKISYILPLFI